MIHHVAVFRWKEATSPAQVQALEDGLARLAQAIPQIRSYRFGPDVALSQGNLDFGLCAEFASRDDFLAYVNHPSHHKVVEELIVPIRSERAAVQFEV
jgi:hypothetical protein